MDCALKHEIYSANFDFYKYAGTLTMPQIWLFTSMSANYLSGNIVRIISLFVRTKFFLS